jgi:hypothetical protein
MNGQPLGASIGDLDKLLDSLTDEVVLFLQVADYLVRRLLTYNSLHGRQPLSLFSCVAPAEWSAMQTAPTVKNRM